MTDTERLSMEHRISECGGESDDWLRDLLKMHTPSNQTGEDVFAGRCMLCDYTRDPCTIASAAATALERAADRDAALRRAEAAERQAIIDLLMQGHHGADGEVTLTWEQVKPYLESDATDQHAEGPG